MATIKRIPGNSDALKKALSDLHKTNLKVGWFESSKYPTEHETPVAYVAAINELGPHARPFMRPTEARCDKEWAQLMAQLSKQILKNKWTVPQALEALGLQVEADIRQSIKDVTDPPLSLITLMARKYRLEHGINSVTGATIGQFAKQIATEGAGNIDVSGVSDKPLEETGLLYATVTSVVSESKT